MGVMLLEPHVVAQLERLLGASTVRTLRETQTAFTAAFPDAGATAFQALACLLIVLKDGPSAQWEERLAGYFLLLTAGTLVPGLRPEIFDGFLIEAALETDQPPSHEAAFVRCLLLDSHDASSVDSLTPSRWAQGGGPLRAPRQCTRQQLQLSLDRRRSAYAESGEGSARGGRTPFLWQRPLPPQPLPVQPCELAWAVGSSAALQGGLNGGASGQRLSQQRQAVRDILQRGAAGALALSEAQAAITELQSDAHGVLELAPPPPQLPGLMRHNPGLAAQLLLRLADTPEAELHFQAAARSEPGLQTMEVVSRLAQSGGPLPDGFLQAFLVNSFAACDAEQDAMAAGRKVRLVCAFTASLVRARLGDVLPVLVEAQAFCIRFSRNREAAALYRLLLGTAGELAAGV